MSEKKIKKIDEYEMNLFGAIALVLMNSRMIIVTVFLSIASMVIYIFFLSKPIYTSSSRFMSSKGSSSGVSKQQVLLHSLGLHSLPIILKLVGPTLR